MEHEAGRGRTGMVGDEGGLVVEGPTGEGNGPLSEESSHSSKKNSSSNADDLPPPLEECEDILALREKLLPKAKRAPSSQKTGSSSSASLSAGNSQKVATTTTTTTTSKPSAKKVRAKGKKSSGFGGLSAGFLLGGTTAKKSSSQKKSQAKKKTTQKQQQVGSLDCPKTPANPLLIVPSATQATPATNTNTRSANGKRVKSNNSIPTIKPKNPSAPTGVIPEVQQAMKDAAPFMERTKDKWMNADLLTKFQQSPFLLEALQDPTVLRALKEFESNPAGAKQKYAGNHKVMKFFQEYFALMGAHFTELGDKEEVEKEKEAAQNGKASSGTKGNTSRGAAKAAQLQKQHSLKMIEKL